MFEPPQKEKSAYVKTNTQISCAVTVQAGLCLTWTETKIIGFFHAKTHSSFNYHKV